MALHCNLAAWKFGLAILIIALVFAPRVGLARKTDVADGLKNNAIDRCWRWNPDWRRNRQQLAACSRGFAGKMNNNMGRDLTYYEVTDASDNAVNPKPGTLRYGATLIKGKVWITFQKDMNIILEKPLLVSSFTAIDGRGANIHIAGNACLLIFKVMFNLCISKSF